MALFGKKKSQWEMDDYRAFFQRESDKENNSQVFTAVTDAFDAYERAREELQVDEPSVKRLVEAREALSKACGSYLQERQGARSLSGKERMDVISHFAQYHSGVNRDLDERRLMEAVAREQQAGKTAFDQEKGKAVSMESAARLTAADLRIRKAGAVAMAYARLGTVSQEGRRQLSGIDRLTQEHSRMNLDEIRDVNILRQYEGQSWEKITPIPTAKLTITGKADTVGANVSRRLKVEYNGRKGFFTERNEMEEIKEIARRGISREQDPQVREKLQKNGGEIEEICDYVAKEKDAFWAKLSYDQKRDVLKKKLTEAKEAADATTARGKETAERIDSLLEDEKALNSIIGIVGAAKGVKVASNVGNIDLGEGHELTSRNVATSRVADLLGIGGIVAHSRPMEVTINGETVKGSFMEFAEGVDLTNQDYLNQRQLNQVDFSLTEGFARDMTSIEVLDFLCVQNDRHARNMFYKLSEPDENGKRRVMGLQGIDNDVAFSTSVEQNSATQGTMDHMTFIDRNLAEKVKGLDREKLEYALGDILSPAELDAMSQRVEAFQNHMRDNMVEISPDGWKLDEYDMTEYGKDLSKSGLDKRGQNYVKGLRDIESSRTARNLFGAAHKNYFVNDAIKQKQAAFQEAEKAEDQLYDDLQEMFRQAEADTPKKEPVREQISFKNFARPDTPRPRRSPVTIGLRPERQAEKQQSQPEKGMAVRR